MELFYGNLNKEQLNDAQKENLFTKYLNEFINTPPPDFAQSTEEIEYLIKLDKSLKNNPEYDEVIDFTELYDLEFAEKGIPHIFTRIGIKPTNNEIDKLYEISQEIGSLIMKLKMLYNRPRPYQVALYSKQPLFPYPTHSGHSPAYPSGHASQSLMLCKVLGQKYKSKKLELNKIADEIAFSRLVLGCHYPSDNKFGQQIVNKLCTKPDIIQKYLT